jgi:PKD repeat protein
MIDSRREISYRYIGTVALVLGLLLLLVLPASAASTTGVHLVKYASDRTTVLSEKNISADWMSQNLPVLGDGTTHYYHQGPTFDPANLWDPAESKNVLNKDMGAVQGTDLKDLCNLVGGMTLGDMIEVRSQDGFSKQFAYGSVYSPPARQGPIGLVWYKADEGMVPAYQTGMRLVFFADTSVNPWQLHVFGNSDMGATIPEDEWHYFDIYPTTTGLSVQSVQEIRIYSTMTPQPTTPAVLPVPPGQVSPSDPDHDGIFEDLNGNGGPDFNDVVLFFNQMDWIAENEPLSAFDFNTNGQIDFNDIVRLFNML